MWVTNVCNYEVVSNGDFNRWKERPTNENHAVEKNNVANNPANIYLQLLFGQNDRNGGKIRPACNSEIENKPLGSYKIKGADFQANDTPPLSRTAVPSIALAGPHVRNSILAQKPLLCQKSTKLS